MTSNFFDLINNLIEINKLAQRIEYVITQEEFKKFPNYYVSQNEPMTVLCNKQKVLEAHMFEMLYYVDGQRRWVIANSKTNLTFAQYALWEMEQTKIENWLNSNNIQYKKYSYDVEASETNDLEKHYAWDFI